MHYHQSADPLSDNGELSLFCSWVGPDPVKICPGTFNASVDACWFRHGEGSSILSVACSPGPAAIVPSPMNEHCKRLHPGEQRSTACRSIQGRSDPYRAYVSGHRFYILLAAISPVPVQLPSLGKLPTQRKFSPPC